MSPRSASCLAALAMATSAFAETITIPAAADNTLYEDPTGMTSNGAGAGVFAGISAQALLRRALVRFDVASNLPHDAIIESVTLRMTVSRTISGTEIFSLHRALNSWGEGASVAPGEGGAGAAAELGDATWIHRFYPDVLWDNAGGDFATEMSAFTLVTGLGAYEWQSAAMLDEVRAWLIDPASNHGWMIRGNESVEATAKRLDSREHPDEASRPALTIQYTVPEPAVAWAFVSSFSMAAHRRRR